MTIHSNARKPKIHHKRRPRRLSAVERVVERAEDRYDIRELVRRRNDPEYQERIPWEQVKKELGLE
jgi:hypothetical protein